MTKKERDAIKKEVVDIVLKYVEKHAERESIFLTPNPAWFVNAVGLLDHLYEVTGVPKPR